jgi:hypothetical protein
VSTEVDLNPAVGKIRYVNYTYGPANPQRLTRIESNDGARLDVQYNASGLIWSISSDSRAWTYSYSNRALQSL